MPLRRHHMTSQSYSDAVLATNPVGYWRLGERSGLVARDEMGKNHGAYVGGPTLGVPGLLAGDADTAVTFGTGKYVSLTPPAAALANAFSVVAWYVVSGAGVQCLVAWRAVAQVFGVYHISGDIQVFVGASSALGSGGGLANGLVHMAVVCYDGVRAAVYSDGGLKVSALVGVPSTAGAVFNIGQDPYNQYWLGTPDEVTLYNRALTAAEIAVLYRIGMGR